MKCVIVSAFYHIKSWGSSFRIFAAFILGMGLCLLNISKYLSFANAIGSSVQAFEPFIVVGSSVSSFLAILLGSLLLLSDAPFVSELSKYEMLIIGRKKWLWSQVLYIFLACLIYSLAMLLFIVATTAVSSKLTFSGAWSPAMVMLAEKQPDIATRNFKLVFAFPDFVNSVTPYLAVFLTLVFNTLYMALISLCIFVVNILTKRNSGWIVAVAIHIVGYVGYANSGYFLPTGRILSLKYSLLCCATPAYHYIKQLQMSSLYCFMVFAILITILVYICERFASKIEPFN